MKIAAEKNANRFTGFSDVYDNARPRMPSHIIEIAMRYLRREAENVVDLGCGTGLSTLAWQGHCRNLVGIEPSDDMRKIAEEKQNATLSFRKGFSHETGLPSDYADVVVCSQSFHWMEPHSTLAEVDRILKSNGLFMTVDCDWPPSVHGRVERAYSDLFDKVHYIEDNDRDVSDSFVRYSKAEHLKNIKDSGYFYYARELVFSNSEPCNAKRLVLLARSQGSLQGVLRLRPELIKADVEQFERLVDDTFGEEEFQIEFSYRVRIGLKG